MSLSSDSVSGSRVLETPPLAGAVCVLGQARPCSGRTRTKTSEGTCALGTQLLRKRHPAASHEGLLTAFRVTLLKTDKQ